MCDRLVSRRIDALHQCFLVLLEKVILQGNMTEYYPACDILSTTEISNIAHEY